MVKFSTPQANINRCLETHLIISSTSCTTEHMCKWLHLHNARALSPPPTPHTYCTHRARKKLEFQLVLRTSRSNIKSLLAQGHFLLILVNDFAGEWLAWTLQWFCLIPLRSASLIHKNHQRHKIICGMHPIGCKDQSIDLKNN